MISWIFSFYDIYVIFKNQHFFLKNIFTTSGFGVVRNDIYIKLNDMIYYQKTRIRLRNKDDFLCTNYINKSNNYNARNDLLILNIVH